MTDIPSRAKSCHSMAIELYHDIAKLSREERFTIATILLSFCIRKDEKPRDELITKAIFCLSIMPKGVPEEIEKL